MRTSPDIARSSGVRTERIGHDRLRGLRLLVVLLCALVTGCFGPNKANVQLRKDKQQLQGKIQELQADLEADRARITGLEQAKGTIPTLPQDRLDRMFTVHGLQIGRLTGGTDLDPAREGDEALKVYVVPTDENGDALKATGRYVIEAFDLAKPDAARIGHWEFTPEQAKANWYRLGLREFVLTCPWQTGPEHSEITLKISFTDELTGRVFTRQQVVHVTPPPAPATRSATTTQSQ